MLSRWFPFLRITTCLCGLALILAACAQKPLPADPALWHITGPDGSEGWLFGTIHAAPAPLQWKTAKVAAALNRSDEVLVELANVADDAAVAQTFASLSHSPGLPPMSERVPPQRRKALDALLSTRGIDPADMHDMETWAIALTLARPQDAGDAVNGVDREVLAAAKGKPVIELEGAKGQLSIFDTLPEAEQRDLLNAVIDDAGALDDESKLVDIWRKGDMRRIEAETRTGLLADPELRTTLFTARNERWTRRITAELRAGRKPFVAVGAAHMAGEDGLVGMLARQGYTVRRIQ